MAKFIYFSLISNILVCVHMCVCIFPQNGIIFWRVGPFSIGFPSEASVLGTHLYQRTSWWCSESLRSASASFFFEDSFNVFSHLMMDDLQVQFLTKNCMTPMPHPTYSPDLTSNENFLFPWMKKNPQRETFCHCGRGETKNGKNTKRYQNR